MQPSPPIVLTFAGSDPTSGAGLPADIMTLSSLGCHPLSVVTAITVQDSSGIENLFPLDADWIADQARSVLEDMPVAAFKIGLVGNVENIAIIAEIVSDYPDIPLILDPVLASNRGDELASVDIIAALCDLLVPQSTLITPNSIEARRLTQDETDENDNPNLSECAQRLLQIGCEYVLIKGTHENTPQVTNSLYGREGLIFSENWERLNGNYHGSGCTLASAIAANLANGLDVVESVKEAQDYTWNSLRFGFRPGMGQYLPDRFFWAREPEKE